DPTTALAELGWVESELGAEPNVAVVRLDDPGRAEELAERLRSAGYEAKSWEELAKNLVEMVRGDQAYAAILSAAVTAVVALSILNITVMVVESRKREIGVLKAIGATSAEVFAIYSLVALVQALIGYLIGLAVASAGAGLMGVVTVEVGTFPVRVTAELSPWDAALGLAYAALLSLAASAYSSLRAARVRPAEVMRFG
ncbi:MAG: hypothetical protein DRO06_03060, partial [Thermoproteota archaeon]